MPNPNLTTRERFSAHSADPACSGCHALIDPIGFGLENYDGIGQFRTTENGKPVDASGLLTSTRDIDGAFKGGVELATKLASSAESKACLALQAYRWAFGRREVDGEGAVTEAMAQSLAAGGLDVRELAVAITKSLADVKSDILIFENVSNPVSELVATFNELEGHGAGMRTMWTSSTNQSETNWGDTTSIDQIVARAYGSRTRIPNLNLGVLTARNLTKEGQRATFNNGAWIQPVGDPAALFTRLFPNSTAPAAPTSAAPDPAAAAEAAYLRARGKSRIDQLTAEITSIKGIAGTEEQAKLDLHLTGLRELETSLPNSGGMGQVFQGTTCAAPNVGNPSPRDDLPGTAAAMNELLYQAINCDITRIATVLGKPIVFIMLSSKLLWAAPLASRFWRSQILLGAAQLGVTSSTRARIDEMKSLRFRDCLINTPLVLILGGCSGERADAINDVGAVPMVGMVPTVGMDPKPAPSSPSPAPSTSAPSAATSGLPPQALRTCTPSAVTAIASPQMSSEGDGKRTIGDKGYVVTPDLKVNPALPHGVVKEFTMNSADSKIFPGVNGPYTRRVWVYVPVGYVPGTPAPFIVVQDGTGYADDIPNILDSLIPGKCLPKMVGIMIDNGGGSGPRSERGFEYDTVSDRYARFLETEVFPRVEQEASVVLTKDGEGGAALGGSSGGTAAFGLGWFRPERFRRIITYSGSYVDWQSPKDPLYPYGAWEYHATLIPMSEPKPLRVWLEVASGDWDAMSAPRVQRDMQTANLQMYETLAAKGNHVQYNYAQNAGHNDPIVSGATLVDALIWLWRGYPIE